MVIASRSAPGSSPLLHDRLRRRRLSRLRHRLYFIETWALRSHFYGLQSSFDDSNSNSTIGVSGSSNQRGDAIPTRSSPSPAAPSTSISAYLPLPRSQRAAPGLFGGLLLRSFASPLQLHRKALTLVMTAFIVILIGGFVALAITEAYPRFSMHRGNPFGAAA